MGGLRTATSPVPCCALQYSRMLLLSAAAAAAGAPGSYPTDVECDTNLTADLLVYGGTAAGVVAAVAASRMLPEEERAGVVLLNPSRHLGGMVSSGLGWTDGKDSGGIAAEFFAAAGGYHFPPSTAERVFNELVANATSVRVAAGCHITSVHKAAGTALIGAVGTSAGGTFAAEAFIDASYEGDLLAAAGVGFTVGREPRRQYNESAAGRLPAPPVWGCGCNWNYGPVDGRGADGVSPLPMVSAGPMAELGAGDAKVQAYNFRLCFTQDPANLAPFPAPTNYDPARWELLRRVFAGPRGPQLRMMGDFFHASPVGDNKTDVNNGGGLGSDYVGGSWAWPTAGAAERAALFEEHRQYTLGLLHFLATDATAAARNPRIRAEVASWGLCADEFVDRGNWPHQLYVREARRMLGNFTFTQHDRVEDRTKPDSIAVGDYNIDGHAVERVMLPNGTVTNEGCLSGWAKHAGVKLPPFEIPYRAMLPRHDEAANLLVTCALSATHAGSGPLRLEPQYMNLGHAAGVAAALVALDRGHTSVQQVNVGRLQQLLAQQGVTYSTTLSAVGGRTCALKRCIASPVQPGGGGGTNCSAGPRRGGCGPPLAASEWLGASGAWTLSVDAGIAVATKATHLKKGVAGSAELPPSMVRAAGPGTQCILNVDGATTVGGLFACTLPAPRGTAGES